MQGPRYSWDTCQGYPGYFPESGPIKTTHKNSNSLSKCKKVLPGHNQYGSCSWLVSITITNVNNIEASALHWRHNDHDGVSNYQPYSCLLNRLFRRRSQKTSKLCVTGLCARNSPRTGEFPAQRASNVENGSIWWRHRGNIKVTEGRQNTYCAVPNRGAGLLIYFFCRPDLSLFGPTLLFFQALFGSL